MTAGKIGRTLTKINWDKVDSMLAAGCLGTEIAAYLGVHPNTFYRHVEEEKGVSFSEYMQEKRSFGDYLLRQKQFDEALNGEKVLLIWLGKQRLGQKEKITDDDEKELANRIVDGFEQYIKSKNLGDKPEQDIAAE